MARAELEQPVEEAEAGSLATLVASQIRGWILEGSFAPGQRLIEAELSRRCGAGRSTIREALGRLATDGLVEVEPYRGASVRRLDRREVGELYRVRELLEGLAARGAAEMVLRSPAARAAFSAELGEIAARHRAGDTGAYLAENRRYHQAIVRHADNRVLERQLDMLIVPVFRLQFRALMTWELVERSRSDHARIAAAVLTGDADAADALMRAHVRASGEEVAALPDAVFGD